jgi:hypothetical protein
VSPDGKTWRFTLRKGIQFHRGQGEMTAEDVAFSYEMYTSDKSIASNKSILLGIVDRLEVTGPHEMAFHLKAPDVTFAGRVSNGQFGVASKKYYQAVGEAEATAKPVGTGPFRLVEHRRQESATFEAVAPHWRQTPGFATLVLRRVPDQSARLAMLRGGEIDFPQVTVGGTHTALMAASLAHGSTLIKNAACEPEVRDLADCLVKMGARIKGAGTSTIEIEGVASLSGARHAVLPDRIEAGTYAFAVAMTGGEILLEGADESLLPVVLDVLRETGARVEQTSRG